MKLSPNLRKPYRDTKGSEEIKQGDIEYCKIERLILTSGGDK